MDRGSIDHCLQDYTSKHAQADLFEKVLQGKIGSYIKVIKNKVLIDGDIFFSGILCSGVTFLTEKMVLVF